MLWMVVYLFVDPSGAILPPICDLPFEDARTIAGTSGEVMPMPANGVCPQITGLVPLFLRSEI